MRALHCILLAALLALPSLALAQQAPPIEQAMSAEEFKAAGLDKLDAAELARLNAWLDRTIGAEAEKAAALEKDRVESQARGFFSFGKTDPILASIVGEFRGYAQGRVYKLDNGQEWEQVEPASLVGVRVDAPKVRITPSVIGNSWFMQVDGYNTRAKVRRTK